MKKIFSFLLGLSLFSSALAYSDVANNNPYQTAIDYLTTEGVMQGYSDGTFRPDTTINRAEFTKMLVAYYALDFDQNSYSNCFPDVTTEWYAPYVCYAKSQNWIAGYSDGTFHPEATINLAEALKIDFEVSGTDLGNCASQTDSWYSPYLCRATEKNFLTQNDQANLDQPINRAFAAQLIYDLHLDSSTSDADSTPDDQDTTTPDDTSDTSDDTDDTTTDTTDTTQYQNKELTDASTSTSDFLIANSSRVQLMSTDLSVNLENVWGEKISYTFTGSASNFTKFYLIYPNSDHTVYYAEAVPTSNTITFNTTQTGEKILIPKDAEATLTLYADIAPSSGVVVGEQVQFTFNKNSFQGLGYFSQSKYSGSSLNVTGDITSKAYTMSKGALSLTLNSNSPESYRTPSVNDNIAIFDIANVSSKSSQIEMLNISLSGSFIHASANLVTLRLYESSSYSASTMIASVSATPSDGSVDFGNITTFIRPLTISSNSSKSLYAVIDTTEGNCNTSPSVGLCSNVSGNSTFQLLIGDYSWSNDGATFQASAIGGVSLPVEGNVLRY